MAKKRGAKPGYIPPGAWSILRQQARRLARKVAPIYRLLGWTWHDKGVPTEAQLRRRAIDLIANVEEMVRKHGPDCGARSETGGLRCRVVRSEMDWHLAIEFVISQDHHVYFPEEPRTNAAKTRARKAGK